ncbi:MAG: endo-1,4-beta-xylanase [Chloroflexi bacterium]|nr:endo-1,4-beta-xylanase [Chloroflexota bacterium]
MIRFSVPQVDFVSAWSFMSDADGVPCAGEVAFDSSRLDCDTPAPRAALNLLYTIEGFGEVMARTAVLPHSDGVVDLHTALVQGRRDQIARLLERCRANGFAVPVEWAGRYAAVSSLADLYYLGEQLALALARWRIQQRKAAGPLGLRFGAQAFGVGLGEAYERHFRALCDCGTAPLYFFLTRPSRDRFTWDATDRVVDWLTRSGIEVEGAPLIWFHPYGIPPWMRSLSFDEAKDVALEQVRAAIARFGDRVHVWEMINEPQDGDANGLNLTVEQLLDITALVSAELKRLQPHAVRMINFSDPFGARSYPHERPSVPPAYILKRCAERGIEYDAIGLQFYFGIKRYFSCRDLLTVDDLVESFAPFGKPLRVTEVGMPSQHAVDPTAFFGSDHPAAGGWWHGPWNETRQAEFSEGLYTLCAAQPNMSVITWWDFADRGVNRDIGARFIPHGGLLRRDLTPKPAYERLLAFKQFLRGT